MRNPLVATAIVLGGCSASGREGVHPMVTFDEQADPIGLDDPGPGGFTGREALAHVGTRQYEAVRHHDTMHMDIGDPLVDADYGPYALSVDADGAAAEWVTSTSYGELVSEVLRLTVEVSIRSEAGEVDVAGTTVLIAQGELVDERLVWMSYREDPFERFVLTGTLPAWVGSTIADGFEDTACGERTRDPQIWRDGVVGILLGGDVAEASVKVGIDVDDEECGDFENVDVIHLVPSG